MYFHDSYDFDFRKLSESDWQAARDTLAYFSDRDLADYHKYDEALVLREETSGEPDAVRDRLAKALDRVQSVVAGGSSGREICSDAEWFYTTGEPDEIDLPSQTCCDVWSLLAAGVFLAGASAAGPYMSIDLDEAEKARPARYQRMIELLAPTRILGKPFTPDMQFVFFSDAETIEGCWEDIVITRNPRAPFSRDTPPPFVLDLDDYVFGLSLSYLDSTVMKGVPLRFNESFVLDTIDAERDRAYPSFDEDEFLDLMQGADDNVYPTQAALRQGVSDWLERERGRPTRTQDRRTSSYSNIRRSRHEERRNPAAWVPRPHVPRTDPDA
jgi:hypothetical protein